MSERTCRDCGWAGWWDHGLGRCKWADHPDQFDMAKIPPVIAKSIRVVISHDNPCTNCPCWKRS